MALAARSMLGSQLRLVEPIASGGAGTVWRAAHLGLGADVAVKILDVDPRTSPMAALRFREEARATAQIQHPNILRVFDRGTTDDGFAYIVMELLVGETLRERLARGPLSTAEAVHVVVQIAKGLEAAHQCNLVHRDLKPANVFLCDDDELPFVKILDFGVAKRLGDDALLMTTAGALVGTLPYMSPEQLAGKEVDTRADLWALGVVSYQALAGHRPFTGDTLDALIDAVERGTFTPLGDIVAELPRAVDDWVARALQSRIESRFQSATEMLQAWRDAWGLPSTKPSLRPRAAAAKVAAGGPTVRDRDMGQTVVDAPRQRDATLSTASAVAFRAPEPQGEIDGSDLAPSQHGATSRRAWLVAIIAVLMAGAVLFSMNARQPPPQTDAALPNSAAGSAPSTETTTATPSAGPPAPTSMASTAASAVNPRPLSPVAKPAVPAVPSTSSSAQKERDKRTDAAGERLGI